MSRNYPAPFRGRGYPTMTNREIDQRALLIAKDAEIEQLKESAKYDAFLREKYRGLITKLCDALELPFEEWTDQSDLLQHARKGVNQYEHQGTDRGIR